jgi:hypothetical protein
VLKVSPNAAEPEDAGGIGVAGLGRVWPLGHSSVKDLCYLVLLIGGIGPLDDGSVKDLPAVAGLEEGGRRKD